MSAHQTVPSLMLMTLGIVLVIAIVLLIWFLRRPSNRHPMHGSPDRNVAKEIDEGTRGG